MPQRDRQLRNRSLAHLRRTRTTRGDPPHPEPIHLAITHRRMPTTPLDRQLGPLHRDPLRVGDRAIARHVRKIGELQARVRVLEEGGPLGWVRYLKLKWRQRRARRDDARRG